LTLSEQIDDRLFLPVELWVKITGWVSPCLNRM
jgi:hypothetical protein